MFDWNTSADQLQLLLTGAILQGSQAIALLVTIVILILVVYTVLFQAYNWLLEVATWLTSIPRIV